MLEEFAFAGHPHLVDGLKINETALVALQKHYERRLMKLLPGVKLVKWGLDLRERPDSDQLKPNGFTRSLPNLSYEVSTPRVTGVVALLTISNMFRCLPAIYRCFRPWQFFEILW